MVQYVLVDNFSARIYIAHLLDYHLSRHRILLSFLVLLQESATVSVLIWHLGLCHFPNTKTYLLFAIDLNILHSNFSDELSTFVHRLRKFERSTILTVRSHHITIEIANRKFYSNNFVLFALLGWWTSLFPVNHDFQKFNVNRYFLFPWIWFLYCTFTSIKIYQFLSLSENTCVIVALSPCFEWIE